MAHPTKIVCIGAGSYSFGITTLVSLLRSETLKGSELVLVDRNEAHLEIMLNLITWLNEVWGSSMRISAQTNHRYALAGAQFVINAIEVGPREGLWESDYNITLKYGLRQPYAENSGPGGFAHAARNILPVLEIAHDIEKLCPEALFINFATFSPRYSKMKPIGIAIHPIFKISLSFFIFTVYLKFFYVLCNSHSLDK